MKLEVIADKLGLSMEQGVPYGSAQGYPFFVVQLKIDTLIKAPMMAFVFEKTLSKDEKKAIQKASGLVTVRYDSVALDENACLLPFRYGIKPSQKATDYLYKMTDVFKQLGLKSLNHCPICGQGDTDTTRVVQGAIVNCHTACVQSFQTKFAEHIEEQEKSNQHMVRSLIYACVGAIIGAIPTMISILGFQYMFALLYALIPLASFYGYKKGGAVKKTWVPIAVSIISVIIVVLMNYGLYVMIAESLGVSFSIAMKDQEFSSAFVSDLGFSLLFILIGVIFTWRQMFKQTTGAMKQKYEGLK